MAQAFDIQQLLSRSSLERVVYATKMLFSGLALVVLFCLCREFFDSYLDKRRAITEMNQGIEIIYKNHKQQKAVQPNIDYGIIASQPILGTLEAATPRPTPQLSAAKTVVTPLALIGTFISAGQEPYAIIEDQKKNNQDVFNIGDQVFSEAKLLSISVDRVEIERNGQTETLVLDDLTQGKGDSKGGIASLDGNQFTVDEAELDKALENLPLLLTQARAVPYFKDGMAIGLRLFAIKSDSIFEKIGLKNGDILKAVNGSSLADITQAMKLFELLKAERSLTLKLERNAEEKEFKYEIR